MISARLRFFAALTLALSCAFGIGIGVVSAHAQYQSSTPQANSTISAAPSTVQITYTQELSEIHISIMGPHGTEVTTAPAKFDLENRFNASVPMGADGPGVYTVLWHNVSGDDGDPNDGQFVFTVVGTAPSATSTTTTPAATTTPVPAPSASGAAAVPAASAPTSASAAAPPAPTCIDNGVLTQGIHDSRVDTYCKRQAIRMKYAGQIDEVTFNAALADGEGLESALSDAMADFQMEQSRKKH
jgi:methionine-rich copper-binding protein CopC